MKTYIEYKSEVIKGCLLLVVKLIGIFLVGVGLVGVL